MYLVISLIEDNEFHYASYCKGKILGNFSTIEEAQYFINSENNNDTQKNNDYYEKRKEYNKEFIKNINLPDNFEECYNFLHKSKGHQGMPNDLPLDYKSFIENNLCFFEHYNPPINNCERKRYVIVEQE